MAPINPASWKKAYAEHRAKNPIPSAEERDARERMSKLKVLAAEGRFRPARIVVNNNRFEINFGGRRVECAVINKRAGFLIMKLCDSLDKNVSAEFFVDRGLIVARGGIFAAATKRTYKGGFDKSFDARKVLQEAWSKSKPRLRYSKY